MLGKKEKFELRIIIGKITTVLLFYDLILSVIYHGKFSIVKLALTPDYVPKLDLDDV